jgi:hypothetical protein
MAKASFPCAQCGASITVGGPGYNRKRADDLAAWKQSRNEVCVDCWKAEQAEQHQQDAQQNAAAGLPALTGSEKQILWAEGIRAQKLAALDDAISAFPREDRADPRFPLVIAALQQQARASWWIDHRDRKTLALLQELAETIEPPIPDHLAAAAEEAATAVLAEATVYPESPLTPTVAEIRIQGRCVTIAFPEKRDDFRELVKRKLDYHWQRGQWLREFAPNNTDLIPDFAAETGCALLASGFPIRVIDDGIRQAIIGGTFKALPTRWLRARTDGPFAGWFSLTWKRPDDLYAAALRLHGARYDSPNVVIPATSADEVLDFAERYQFAVSVGAQRIVTEQQALQAGVLHIPRPVLTDPDPIKGQTQPTPLVVPESVEIDDDLRDL